MLKVGDNIPNINVTTHKGETVNLTNFKGKKVILFFYPRANTPGCTAQSTDKKVNEITPNLFNKADNPYDMIKLSIDEIREIIKPVGLSPAKSKGIWNLSKILIDKYNGRVPEDISKLEELPSVGHKTASVVVSQGFGQPAFPVDTHIHRLMFRWGLSNGKNVERTEKDAKRIFPKEKWNELHLRIIFYGRE